MSIKNFVEHEKLKQDELERQIGFCRESMRHSLLLELESRFDSFKELYAEQLTAHLNTLKVSKVVDYLAELIQEYNLTLPEYASRIKKKKAEIALNLVMPLSNGIYGYRLSPSLCSIEIDSKTFKFIIKNHSFNMIDDAISKLSFRPYLNRLNTLQIQDVPELEKINKKILNQKFQTVLGVRAELSWALDSYSESYNSIVATTSFTDHLSLNEIGFIQIHGEEIAATDSVAIQSAIARSYLHQSRSTH